MLKVKLVSIEEGITALGFRRIASIARKLNPDTEIYFIAIGNLYSLTTHLFPNSVVAFTDRDLDIIAEELSKADLLCFSSMTPSAFYVEKIIYAVKLKNPKIFILFGGIHCIMYPEKAIKYVDAICTGEGEAPFEKFYEAFSTGKEYLTTSSMWFNTKDGIIRNGNRALSDNKELNLFPHLFYDLTCKMYDFKSKTFRLFTQKDYILYNSFSYKTVWTIGCPFSCTYCANDTFISKDKNYRLIRHSSVDYIIEEIENVIKTYPFISTIVFFDDNFIGISLDVIASFSEQYKKRINLPFVVFGLHPNLITKEKIDLLGNSGMNRGRMGIQSGSEKTLSFYNRTTSLLKIKKSAKILAGAVKKYKMIPVAYDIISDNPLETKEDIIQTLKFLYDLERPYTLNIFSLRVFPGTKLWDYFQNHPEVDIRSQTTSYLDTKNNMANILLYFLAIAKPPKIIFMWLLKYVKGDQGKQRFCPVLHLIAKSTYLSVRALAHLRKFDFTTIAGPWGYYFWKMGFIKSKKI